MMMFLDSQENRHVILFLKSATSFAFGPISQRFLFRMNKESLIDRHLEHEAFAPKSLQIIYDCKCRSPITLKLLFTLFWNTLYGQLGGHYHLPFV